MEVLSGRWPVTQLKQSQDDGGFTSSTSVCCLLIDCLHAVPDICHKAATDGVFHY